MKKTYTSPSAEVVKFEYKDQVVAASGMYPGDCTVTSVNQAPAGTGSACTDPDHTRTA